MTREAPVNVAASVRARLLKVSKDRQEDFTLTLMNYGAERFLYRLARQIFLSPPPENARIGEPFTAQWRPGGPWT